MFIRQSLRSGHEPADHVRMKFGSRELSISIVAVFQWILQVNVLDLENDTKRHKIIARVFLNENA